MGRKKVYWTRFASVGNVRLKIQDFMCSAEIRFFRIDQNCLRKISSLKNRLVWLKNFLHRNEAASEFVRKSFDISIEKYLISQVFLQVADDATTTHDTGNYFENLVFSLNVSEKKEKRSTLGNRVNLLMDPCNDKKRDHQTEQLGSLGIKEID